MLVKNCVSIALIGDSETGKSSFARYFKYMDPVDNITHNYYRGIESLNGIGK
jgi:GTPase SAR1 family protein